MKNYVSRADIALIITSLFFVSCQKDFETIENATINEVKVEKGRLVFPSKTAFQNYFNEMKEKNEENIADILDTKFYSKDFYSLRPIVNDRTEQNQVDRHLTKIKTNNIALQMRTNVTDEDILDDIDDLEDIFGEEVFTSFLNQEAELQIGNEVYKYTDTGLFVINVDEINELNNYLDDKSISKDLLTPTDEATRLAYIDSNPCGYAVDIYGDIDYFIPCDYYDDDDSDNNDSDNNDSDNNDSDNNDNNDPDPTPLEELGVIANTLEECDGDNTAWLANIFGTVKVCKDKYESRRRVKTKFWDVDAWLFYSQGIKVKHQKRDWRGIWRKEETDQIALGINSISWKFDVIPPSNSNLAIFPSTRIYIDGQVYESYMSYNNFIQNEEAPLPYLPFTESQPLDLVIEVLVIDDVYISERKIRELFYENIYDKAKDLLQLVKNK